ncbi:MAG: adenylate kinase [Chloroflexi bacterium]|nr:adenylate kinase [Chloroflexota bacterium]
MYLVILGAPGAGKGTQASRLAKEMGLVHIASGNLLREAARSDSPLGLQVRPYVEKGALVPDDIIIALIKDKLGNLDQARGVVFDGFPRTREQAQALGAALSSMGKAIDRVLYIKVSEAELVRRSAGRLACLACEATYHVQDNPPRVPGRCDQCGGELYQRPDDKEERFRRRLRIYEERTAPLIDYYKQAGLLVEITNGEEEIDKVYEELMAAVRAVG